MLQCRWWLESREDPTGQIGGGGGGKLHLLWLRRWQREREPGGVAAGQRLQTRKRWLHLLLLRWRRREPRETSHGEGLLLLRRGREAGQVPDGNGRMIMGVWLWHGQRRRQSPHFLLLLAMAMEQRALGHFLRVHQITDEVGAHPTDCAKLREEGRGKGVREPAAWAWAAFRRRPWRRRDLMELG